MKGNREPKGSQLAKDSRAVRRQAANPHVQKRVMTGLKQVIAKMAADRPTHVASFLALWETAAKDVEAFAEDLLCHPAVGLPPERWSALLAPYDTMNLMMFAPLMDRLTPDEEDVFLEACDALDRSWQKLFAVAVVRRHAAAEVVAALEQARQAAQHEVVRLFMGDESPVLTPAWAEPYDTLRKGRAQFAELLAK